MSSLIDGVLAAEKHIDQIDVTSDVNSGSNDRHNIGSNENASKIEGSRLVKMRNSREVFLANDNNVNYIGSTELQSLLTTHFDTPLPRHEVLFPWLHSYSSKLIPNIRSHDVPDNVCIIRSKNDSDFIGNSGILRSSIDPKDFLISINHLKSINTINNENKLNLVKDSLLRVLDIDENRFLNIESHLTLDNLISLCLKFDVLPFLRTDARVTNLLYPSSRSTVNNSMSNSVQKKSNTRKQYNASRRFDLQCAKMFELSSKIIVYCFQSSNTRIGPDNHSAQFKDHFFCSNCESFLILLKIALIFIKMNYLEASCRTDPDLHILSYDSTDNILPSMISIVPLNINSSNKTNSSQLLSSYDIYSFNCWETNPLHHERLEMARMSSACFVDQSKLVWAGNITDFQIYQSLTLSNQNESLSFSMEGILQDLYKSVITLPLLQVDSNNIHSNDLALFNIPNISEPWILFIKCFENAPLPEMQDLWLRYMNITRNNIKQASLSFPSSGSIGLGNLNINSINVILNTCYLVYKLSELQLKTFFYCTDGYTETSFILVACLIFIWDVPLEKVLLRLHLEYEKPYFLFHSDLQVLGHLQSILREFSPLRGTNKEIYHQSSLNETCEPLEISPEMFSQMFFIRIPPESDFSKLKGPLPSRILPHLYLGSLEHTHSQELLKSLGIIYIVSVGEQLSWLSQQQMQSRNRGTSSPTHIELNKIISTSLRESVHRRVTLASEFNPTNYSEASLTTIHSSRSEVIEQDGFKILHIKNLTDDGKDTLSNQLEDALKFIDECYQNGGKVLVHCMVGVSRSATVCIAECMRRLQCDLLKAYLFVRARRLNVIIQPNLMFMYELLRWQEFETGHRNIDWHILCRSINELNDKYL